MPIHTHTHTRTHTCAHKHKETYAHTTHTQRKIYSNLCNIFILRNFFRLSVAIFIYILTTEELLERTNLTVLCLVV